MIIKELNCDQFAGLNDKNIKFESGLNVIVGDNETGKSTIIDLIYNLFFQKVKIGKKSAEDKEFLAKNFPKLKNNITADYVGGSIIFEIPEGRYRLSKEWSDSGDIKLTLPEGISIKDTTQIEEKLGEILGYGKGVYNELIFSSQKRDSAALKTLLDGDKSSSGISDLTSLLNRAVMETGGVDLDKIENKIEGNIKDLVGNWDEDADMPKGGSSRGINNQWLKGNGAVINAYYTQENLKKTFNEVNEKEQEVDRLNSYLDEYKNKLKIAQESYDTFIKSKGAIENKNNILALKSRDENELEKMENVKEAWPIAQNNIALAKKLRDEKQKSVKRSQFDKIKVLKEQQKQLQDNLVEVKGEDVEAAKDLHRNITSLENVLRGVSITAEIETLNNNKVEVQTLSSGETVNFTNNKANINEAVSITVPDVVNIKLLPQKADVEDICKILDEKKVSLNKLLNKYEVSFIDELNDKYNLYTIGTSKIKEINAEILNFGVDIEQLKQEISSFGEIRDIEVVEKEIYELCGNQTLEMFIGQCSGIVANNVETYQDMPSLLASIESKKSNLEKYNDELDNIVNIPEEYRNIENVDIIEKRLKNDVDNNIGYIDNYKDMLSQKLADLASKDSAEDLEIAYSDAKIAFEHQKNLLKMWRHIQTVFAQIKAENEKNPADDLAENFKKYVSVITGEKMTIDSVDKNLKTSILSNNHLLNFDILSEGSKDTLSLAFRLAVLEYLFPEGNCISIFDDPFTDMDPTRKSKSCALLKEFSKNNQVILMTCDPATADTLGGNRIDF